MIYLLTSLATLCVGPALDLLVRKRAILAAIDGFTFAAVVGFVLGAIVPDVMHESGWLGLGIAVGAFVLPSLLERKLTHDTVHTIALGLAAAPLVVHGVIDGAALQPQVHGAENPLPLAVLLHRIPVALGLWLAVGRDLRTFIGTASLIASATVLGYFGVLALPISGETTGLLHAIVGGTLLHIMVHRFPVAHVAERHARGIGAVIAIVMVVIVTGDFLGSTAVVHGGHDHASAFGDRLLELLAQSGPALILAFLGAGVLREFLPDRAVAWLGRGSTMSQALRGVGFGMPLPVCSCGVVPLFRGLVARNVAPAAGLAFLVATPEIGIDAAILSFSLLGPDMAIARIVAAFVLAMTVALIVTRFTEVQEQPAEKSSSCCSANAVVQEQPALGTRVGNAIKQGLVDTVDDTAAWLMFGLYLAALVAPYMSSTGFADLVPSAQVAMFGLIGIPVYVCAAGATPLAAVFIAAGISPGAALAFLLTGPATNVTTFGVLKQAYGRTAALVFSLCLIVGAFGVGVVANSVLGVQLLKGAHLHGIEAWEYAGAIGLILLIIASIYRTGPRAFVQDVIPIGHDHGDHDHDDSSEEHSANDNSDEGDAHCSNSSESTTSSTKAESSCCSTSH